MEPTQLSIWFRLRQFTSDDIPHVLAILNQVSADEPTTLELLPNGIAITGTTGVLAAHRGRGVATLVKLASLRYLKALGIAEARTHNDTANPPILALNEKLGYRRLPGWLVWAKATS